MKWIELHVNGEPIMFNVRRIIFVDGNCLFLNEGTQIRVDEDYDTIRLMLTLKGN